MNIYFSMSHKQIHEPQENPQTTAQPPQQGSSLALPKSKHHHHNPLQHLIIWSQNLINPSTENPNQTQRQLKPKPIPSWQHDNTSVF